MRLSPKAIIIGSVTDIVSTNIVMLPLVFYIMHGVMKTVTAPAEISSTVAALMKDDTTYFAISLFLGFMCSMLGGYVSAVIADHDEVLNGAFASILCVAGGLYTMASGHSADPLWKQAVFLTMSPLLAALGGYLRLRQVIVVPTR